MQIASQDQIIEIPMIVKAGPVLADGTRKITLEASNSEIDSEGDQILQKALLDSADYFLKHGFIDISHLGEIGERYGVNPKDYIVGRPLRVWDMGGGRTGVDAILFKGQKEADTVWSELTAEPPVTTWRASIYGLPLMGGDGIVDVRSNPHEPNPQGASRYIVKALQWKSLALTKSPVNESIKHNVTILKSLPAFMKSNAEYLAKTYGFSEMSDISLGPTIQNGGTGSGGLNPMGFPSGGTPSQNVAPNGFLHPPRNRVEMLGHYTHHISKGHCPHNSITKANSVYSFREHFKTCCGLPHDEADIVALALMYLLKHR